MNKPSLKAFPVIAAALCALSLHSVAEERLPTAAGRADAATADSYIDLALTYFENDDQDGAHEQLRKAALYEPRNPEVHYSRGVVFLAQGRLREARESFEEAVKFARKGAGASAVEGRARDGLVVIDQRLAAARKRRALYIACGVIALMALALLILTFKSFTRFFRLAGRRGGGRARGR